MAMAEQDEKQVSKKVAYFGGEIQRNIEVFLWRFFGYDELEFKQNKSQHS